MNFPTCWNQSQQAAREHAADGRESEGEARAEEGAEEGHARTYATP
jgi:hypothetical protein